MTRRFDIIVFGATGFTGQYVLRYTQKLTKVKGRNLTWAAAGRNEVKLREVLKNLKEKTGLDDFLRAETVIADLSDEESIIAMTSKAKLLINCCGPYSFTGEAIIKACISTRTHQIDLSGEPIYMEDIELRYKKIARDSGVYIVSACGIDCIPCDLGAILMQQQFTGTLNSIESYIKVDNANSTDSSSYFNYASWESMIHVTGQANQLGALRKNLFAIKIPRLQPVIKWKKLPFKPEIIGHWAVPFPGSDKSVIRRTQMYLYEHKKIRPAQIQTYFLLENTSTVIITVFLMTLVGLLCQFEFGRKLLLRYPRLFSRGYVSNQEPSKEANEQVKYAFILHGKGWKEKLADPLDNYTYPPNKQMIVKVEGKDPAYGSTAICNVLAGIKILTEPDKLPQRGGVYAPGAAFADTSLVEELNENGVTFKIVSESDI